MLPSIVRPQCFRHSGQCLKPSRYAMMLGLQKVIYEFLRAARYGVAPLLNPVCPKSTKDQSICAGLVTPNGG
eukprot:1524028-Amphidinium_carterae.4